MLRTLRVSKYLCLGRLDVRLDNGAIRPRQPCGMVMMTVMMTVMVMMTAMMMMMIMVMIKMVMMMMMVMVTMTIKS